MDITVLTLVKNRSTHLSNLIAGLSRSSLLPAELLIVHMNEEPCAIPTTPFETKQLRIDSLHPLPLAAARNYAAQQAKHEHLIFLDVDCIPGESLIETYAYHLKQQERLLSGSVRYLRPGATEERNYWEELNHWSNPDPIRSELHQLPYELFWSLNFGCSKKTFEAIGGFDEDFIGYGGEDTDFAFNARLHQIPLQSIDAVAFHQYHPSYDPPLNHLQDIIINATVFYRKWQRWPMEGWLRKFQERGLVEWTTDGLILLRQPTQEELEAAVKTGKLTNVI